MKLDKWQEQVLATKGNIVLRSGRQVGKSTIVSIKAGDYALNNENKAVMIIAKVERQALLLFEKILSHIYMKDKKQIKKGKDRPTKHKLMLKNGSIIHCLPAGESGYGIRGFTIDLLIADEAAFIPDDVWAAVTPMLATTGGDIWLLSTPFGRQGYFYKCFNNPNYTQFHVSTPEVASSRDEPMKTRMLENLVEEEKTMSKLEFAQEYLGEFVDELRQFFPDDLIRKCMKPVVERGKHDLYLGVDVARMGKDESTFVSVNRIDNKIEMLGMEVTKKTLITDSIRKILDLDKQYGYRRIYIDDGGMGVGVFDHLLEQDQTKRKVVAINNAARSIDKDEKRKKILKEDLYANLSRLMERGEISLIDDENLFQSLKSVQYEYENGKLKIFGRYTHITEGLIRACWCIKDKSLNIWIKYG